MTGRRKPVRTLWLIGMMGSGKTSVGRRVATRIGLPFVDTDEEIAALVGTSISEFWSDNGEDAFRKVETAVIDRIAGTAAVVAAGGGVVLRKENVDKMVAGRVIWLEADPDELALRIGTGSGRPLLPVGDARAVLSEILSGRLEAYSKTADEKIETGGLSVEEVAEEVIALWNLS